VAGCVGEAALRAATDARQQIGHLRSGLAAPGFDSDAGAPVQVVNWTLSGTGGTIVPGNSR
jgi:hypothetical protein